MSQDHAFVGDTYDCQSFPELISIGQLQHPCRQNSGDTKASHLQAFLRTCSCKNVAFKPCAAVCHQEAWSRCALGQVTGTKLPVAFCLRQFAMCGLRNQSVQPQCTYLTCAQLVDPHSLILWQQFLDRVLMHLHTAFAIEGACMVVDGIGREVGDGAADTLLFCTGWQIILGAFSRPFNPA